MPAKQSRTKKARGDLPTNFNVGDPIKAADINEIQAHVNACANWQVNPDNGDVAIDVADANQTLDWSGLDKRISNLGSGTPTGPWAISIAGTVIGVNPHSTVFHSPSILSSYVITGLATEFPVTESTAGTFPCPPRGYKIWLEIDCYVPAAGANPAMFDPTVNTGRINQGANWPGEPENVVYDETDETEPIQMQYIVPIAFIADPTSSYKGQHLFVDGEERVVVRLFDRNIGTCRVIIDGNEGLAPDDPAPLDVI